MSPWEPAPTIWENCTRNTFRAGAAATSKASKRIRRADQFQIFLALALLALLADAFTRPYPAAVKSPEQGRRARAHARGEDLVPEPVSPPCPSRRHLFWSRRLAGISRADNPAEAVREGLRWYGKGEFDKARDRFAAAREQFDSEDAAKAAIAAFDQACAAHRKGDVAQAREWYLKAGLAHDKGLAASAHFNLGTLAAEEARRLAGEHPENVAPEKRQEILDQLKAAVASFRHCLELQPDNSRARRDIELVRQWIKYYTDQWQAHDREKRRQETNLVAFLEFLIETQRALRESVKALTATAPADAFAEPKRLQDELQRGDSPAQGEDQDRADAPATRRVDRSARQLAASWSKESRCCKAGRAPPVTRCHPPRATSTTGKRDRRPRTSNPRSTSWRRSGMP